MHDDDEKAKKAPGETDATASVATPTAQITGTPAPPVGHRRPPLSCNGVPSRQQRRRLSGTRASTVTHRPGLLPAAPGC